MSNHSNKQSEARSYYKFIQPSQAVPYHVKWTNSDPIIPIPKSAGMATKKIGPEN